jgi:hypothetical protein
MAHTHRVCTPSNSCHSVGHMGVLVQPAASPEAQAAHEMPLCTSTWTSSRYQKPPGLVKTDGTQQGRKEVPHMAEADQVQDETCLVWRGVPASRHLTACSTLGKQTCTWFRRPPHCQAPSSPQTNTPCTTPCTTDTAPATLQHIHNHHRPRHHAPPTELQPHHTTFCGHLTLAADRSKPNIPILQFTLTQGHAGIASTATTHEPGPASRRQHSGTCRT